MGLVINKNTIASELFKFYKQKELEPLEMCPEVILIHMAKHGYNLHWNRGPTPTRGVSLGRVPATR